MKKNFGFSLIEIVVVMGVLSLLIVGAFFIGFPEYDRYVIFSEREYLADTFLESRARTLASGSSFIVSTWSDGYCIKDVSDLCVTPIHNLPSNMTLTSIDLATSTKITIAFSGSVPEKTLKIEINVDQHGLVFDQ